MDKWEILREIQGARLTPNQYRVLMFYWDRSNNDTLIAFYGNNAIANACQMSVNTMKKARRELIKLGWLEPYGVKETGKYRGCLIFEVCCGRSREGEDFTKKRSEKEERYASKLRLVE
jgi:hypothetical protein